jgi:hypothetical protein
MRRQHFFCNLALYSLKLLVIWNFVAGMIILLLRHSRFDQLDLAGISIAGLPVCLLLAAAIASRRLPDPHGFLALLDSHNYGGGMLMATAETGDNSWWHRFPETVRTPGFTADYLPRIGFLLLSLLFLLLCIRVPIRSLHDEHDVAIQLIEMQNDVVKRIETLNEIAVLEEKKAEELKNTLEKIAAGSDRNDPSRTFEALDQLRENLGNESVRESQKMLDELEKLGNAMQSIASGSGELDTAALKKTMADLQRNMAGSGNSEKMVQELAELMKKMDSGNEAGQLSESVDQAAAELGKFLEGQRDKILEQAMKMHKAGLIDKKTLEKLVKEGRVRSLTREDLLKQKDLELLIAPEAETADSGSHEGSADNPADKDGGADGTMLIDQGGALSGGSRGGGSAALDFKRKTSEHNVKIIDHSLPGPHAGALDQSVTVGIGMTAPEVGPLPSGQGQSATRTWEQSGQIKQHSGMILPRHRNAVKNFFDRNKP